MKKLFPIALVLALLLAMLSSPASAATYDVIAERIVEASSDDCLTFYDGADWQFSTTAKSVQAGCYGTSYLRMQSGMCFTDIDVPRGATIVSAELYLYSSYDDSGTVISEIRGEDVNSAGTFTTYANFRDRSRTSTKISWSMDAWTKGEWYESPNIKVVIQEIVNRSGWDEGNAMVIFWGCPSAIVGGRRSAASYDADEDKAARLYIKYSTSQYPESDVNDVVDELSNQATVLGIQVDALSSRANEIGLGVTDLNLVVDRMGVQLGELKSFESRFDGRFSTLNSRLDTLSNEIKAMATAVSNLKTDLDTGLVQIKAKSDVHGATLQLTCSELEDLSNRVSDRLVFMTWMFVVMLILLCALVYVYVWRLKR